MGKYTYKDVKNDIEKEGELFFSDATDLDDDFKPKVNKIIKEFAYKQLSLF